MTTHDRYLELDLLRSIAVVMMVLYHAVYDLNVFYDVPVDPFSAGWLLMARATAILFLLIVGISFSISWDRRKRQVAKSHKQAYPRYLKRGVGVLACALLVSVVTYIFDPETYVRFGILHCIGVSLLLLPLFAEAKEWNLFIGTFIILAGHYLFRGVLSPEYSSIRVLEYSMLPFNLTPASFDTVDYFPLLPWFGVILIGVSIGHWIYVRNHHRRQKLSTFLFPLSTPLGWPGRHALLIYLTHQPILLVVLYFLKS